MGGGFHPISEEQYDKWMDNIIDQTGNSRRFIIMDPNEEAIGTIGLYEINWIHRTCEIGIFLGDSEARGKGYALDACWAIEEYAHNYLNLRKIKLYVVEENERALMMWNKLNYVKVGKYTKERYINGHYCDLVIMEKFL